MSIETPPVDVTPAARTRAPDAWTLQWTPIVAGALTAAAVSSILITFAATIGLGVSSAAPTWRDASVALWLLSGIYLVLQALISFSCGGYVAGRVRVPYDAAEDRERRDGMHGVTAWALAIVLGVVLSAMIASAATRQTALSAPPATTEPSVLSSEIDHLFRGPRRPPSAELAPVRSEAGRILLTSSSHSGVSTDDRAYLIQLVTATTGLAGADAERRVDNVIADSRTAIKHARAGTIILAFSVAAALLLGAIAAWLGAESGGRHRDGMPLSDWMQHSNRYHRRSSLWSRPTSMPE